jgi:outer membrane protein OmpA-like peptidoglycan-associated protein
MIIFLFIAISYIMEVFSSNFKKDEIYNTINSQMIGELNRQNVKLGKDLSLKFINQDINDSDVLFVPGSAELTVSFRRKLDSVWLPYQKIITQDTFLNYISEIRIEGHTDTSPPRNSAQSSYEYNLNLSSQRAQSVLHYVQNMDCYVHLEKAKKERLQFLMTANGMSYSRALNDSGQIAYTSRMKAISNSKSRRVEFRIVTTNEKLIQDLIKKQ